MNRINMETILKIIQNALDGELNLPLILEFWKKYDADFVSNPLLGEAWEELTHFVTDADIRERDTEYSDYQKLRLQEYLTKIRSTLETHMEAR